MFRVHPLAEARLASPPSQHSPIVGKKPDRETSRQFTVLILKTGTTQTTKMRHPQDSC